jgi:hypothetical protein
MRPPGHGNMSAPTQPKGDSARKVVEKLQRKRLERKPEPNAAEKEAIEGAAEQQ